MITRWIPPFILLLALIGSSWFLEELSLDTAERNRQAMGDEPDYSVDDFTTVVMDEEGLPKRRLQAARMVHYSMTSKGELEKPYMIFFAKIRTPQGTASDGKLQDVQHQGEKTAQDSFSTRVYPTWHVKSEHGQVLDSGDEVLLSGKVHMWKNSDAGAVNLDVHTSNLKILPGANYGETDELATISTATSQTSGVGMRAHIKPGRVELLSQVRTVYKAVKHDD